MFRDDKEGIIMMELNVMQCQMPRSKLRNNSPKQKWTRHKRHQKETALT
jgi:hypothetical protein